MVMRPVIDLLTPVRRRLEVRGVVQGVGFRPFVYKLAQTHKLSGFVGNDSRGVFIEIEGPPESIDAFMQELKVNSPPLACVDEIRSTAIPTEPGQTFEIIASRSDSGGQTLVAPDVALCDDCRRELLDPTNRRYRYPFINCTHCGPRFTIIKGLPYDRPLTTMADFAMCPACRAEYEDPLDRRFHAQPIACPECGPQVWLETAGGGLFQPAPGEALAAVRARLRQGQVVAIKGIGGFHLACAADSDAAVSKLRERKGRPDKPLAVMARDLAVVRELASINPAEESLLMSKERPIVLLDRKQNSPLSDRVAPGQQTVGVMLPYSPLHELLFHPFEDELEPPAVLVMTSANRAGEPLVITNDEARKKLAGLADALLLHNREIGSRCDDSVLRVVSGSLPVIVPVRRSRGYAPRPLPLPVPLPPTLAVGGELKAAFCLAEGRRAILSQHIGDLENLETLEALESALVHFKKNFKIEPQLIACDLHPGYLSRQYAESEGLPLTTVQHHHAHIAAVMAENGHSGERPVIGFSFDGTGYGLDGAIWGGELLLTTYAGFERAAHLAYFPLAGGDAAVRRPARLALGCLWAAGLPWDDDLPAVRACSPIERQIVRQQLEKNLNVVPTSSMGRLFDVVAALIGVRQQITYEGQAAIELEALAAAGDHGRYAFDFSDPNSFSAGPLLAAVVADVQKGVDPAIIAARFHWAVADCIVALSLKIRRQHGLNEVALSGGVFQNGRLLKMAVAGLRENRFEVLLPQQTPPNDGGLALGQVVVAGCQPKE